MKRPRSPYAPRRSQYVVAGVIGVVGLLIAALIAVAGVLASGNIPTAPSSYKIQLVRAADTGPAFAPYVDVGTTALDANPVANRAAALRAAGGDIRISRGGASGSELGTACTSVPSLTAACGPSPSSQRA